MRGEAIIYVEIPVKVYFDYSDGEPACQSDPGCEPEVEFTGFDTQKALDDIDWKLKDEPTFDDECLMAVNAAKKEMESL